MASGIYDRCRANWLNKIVDMEADAFIVILLNNSHSFNTAHNELSEITANQLATTGGYTQDDKSLASPGVTQATAVKWDATDTAWTSATFTAYFAAIYDDDVASDPLICTIDFGAAKEVVAGTFTIEWNAAGILTVS